MKSITITDKQGATLADVLQGHVDGEDIEITQQGNGNLVVGFSLATIEIDRFGGEEEN